MKTREGGFTLLEVIISMLLVGAVVLLIFVSHSMIVRVWQDNQAEASVLRLEVVGDRLLRKDWEQMVPYTFSTQRGTYPFLHGTPTRFCYVTTHRLGAKRQSGGGLFFTVLMLEPLEGGMGLYCYKTDIPEAGLAELLRLYAAGTTDPGIEADLLDKAVLLKECDAAVFSYDRGNGAGKGDAGADNTPAPLPLEVWTAGKPPARVRLDVRRGEDFAWVEAVRPRELRTEAAARAAERNKAAERDHESPL